MDTDLMLTAAAVTALTIVACTVAGDTLYRQSVLSIEQLAVTNHYYLYLATGKTSCALK